MANCEEKGIYYLSISEFPTFFVRAQRTILETRLPGTVSKSVPQNYSDKEITNSANQV